MSKAALSVKQVLQDYQGQITLAQIASKLPDLKQNEVSMALCYLMRMRYLTRALVPNTSTKGRKNVWSYTYHSARLPKETE
ncbi:hypothetical protein UFOVP11_46 [uncultured Caudovirales phage]|uniref:Uncharacterized protein n=1 Tax=uncultured Caudovirales phage TaxID=2100421 RepID=A0A6J5KJD0_9CAUD|nr:hypothetical protein UFOVP11_46 [uncultured Caudovirales phage]